MEFLDFGGKEYIIYMDAEFQTYRSPIKDDKLALAGYKLTPPFVYYPNDYKYNTYQFLLNIAFIIVERSGATHNYIAAFPSLLNSSSAFNDGRILEAAYTVASPSIVKEMGRVRPDVEKFAFLSNLSSNSKKSDFLKVNTVYQSDFNPEMVKQSVSTLRYLCEQLAPHSKVVHKGHTDIDAIANSCRLYNMPVPALNTRNLNHYSHKFVGLFGEKHDKKLGTLQELFASRDQELRWLRNTLIADSERYVASIYGEGLELKAHNPLVDCVYAMILDIAVAKYLSD